MNQKIIYGFLFTFMLAISVKVNAQAPIPEVTPNVEANEMAVYKFGTAPTIDGDLSDWIAAGAEFHFIGEDETSLLRGGESWTGPEDRSAIFSFMWDDDFFYFAAVNYDDILSSSEELARIWTGDCIFFYMNTLGGEERDHVANAAFFQGVPTIISWGNANVSADRIPYPDGKIAIEMNEDLGAAGNFMEFAIPLEHLENIEAKVGYEMTLNVGLEEGNQAEDGVVFLAWKNDETAVDANMFPLTFEDTNAVKPSSINNFASQLSIYPNPVNNFITINNLENISGSIYTIAGVKVKDLANSTNKIDVSDLNKGVYLIKVVSENKLYTAKFIK